MFARVSRGRDGGGPLDDRTRAWRNVTRRRNSPWSPRAVPLKQEIVGGADSTLVALSVAAGVVLLLACVNVAGLLIGRGAARGREIGVRAALGATRIRLLSQLLVESVVLAAFGGALGVGLSYLAVALLAPAMARPTRRGCR